MQGINYEFLRHNVAKGTYQMLTAAENVTLFTVPLGIVAFIEDAHFRADGTVNLIPSDTGVNLADTCGDNLALTATNALGIYPTAAPLPRGIRIAQGGFFAVQLSGGAAGRQLGYRIQVGLYVPVVTDEEPGFARYHDETNEDELAGLQPPSADKTTESQYAMTHGDYDR